MEYNFANAAANMLENRGKKGVEPGHTVGRNIGLAGIGLAIIFILAIVALVTCFKRRRDLPTEQDLEDGRNTLENECYAAPQDSPPAYGEVVDIYNQPQDFPPDYADVMNLTKKDIEVLSELRMEKKTDEKFQVTFLRPSNLCKDHSLIPPDYTPVMEGNVDNIEDFQQLRK